MEHFGKEKELNITMSRNEGMEDSTIYSDGHQWIIFLQTLTEEEVINISGFGPAEVSSVREQGQPSGQSEVPKPNFCSLICSVTEI